MRRIPLHKIKAILLYFCTNTDPRFLGKVKLMKLFYFLDFMHVKKYGAPVTYDTYINLEHGPIPSTIKNMVDDVASDIDNSALSNTISIQRPEGIDMQRIVPLRQFNESDKQYFSESELDTLKSVCLRFGDKNTKYTEDIAHNEAPWSKTKMLDMIPYTLAAEDNDCMVSKEEIELLLSLE